MLLIDLMNYLKSSSRSEKYECHINIMRVQFVMLGLWKSADLREVNYKKVFAIAANLSVSCIFLLFALHHSMVNVDIQGMTEALMFFILFARIIFSYFWLVGRISSMNRLIEAAERNYEDFEEKSIAFKTGLKSKCDSWNLLFFKSLIWMFCILLLLYAYATGFYMPQSTERKYMFPIRTPWILEESGNLYYYLVLANQFATGAVACSLGTLDVTFSVMSINILSAEVDILGEAWKQTTTYDQLRRNVQQHVLLLR
ncbi:hypothetical protein LSTR_LSTR001637 [Laodelphax striatellus]|uniref:Odorant receptor n=1 Tax=Laodelphax striatellus TaxID=195883 RepID=A0A482XC95_LAOST|nr:hypothetical protein LSTR_LSTR017362 [Laodelphax striatellus]RZF43376.1 hypothetical protein LSTR_LSTR001637 [Laodelphax striatellus]